MLKHSILYYHNILLYKRHLALNIVPLRWDESERRRCSFALWVGKMGGANARWLTAGPWHVQNRGAWALQSSQWNPELGRQSSSKHQSGSKMRESLSLLMYPTWDERTSKKKVKSGRGKTSGGSGQKCELNLWIIRVFGPYNEIKIKASQFL